MKIWKFKGDMIRGWWRQAKGPLNGLGEDWMWKINSFQPDWYTRMAIMGWKLDFGGLLCYHNHYHSFWLRKYQECPFLLKAVNEKYLNFLDKLSKDRAGPWGNEFPYRYLGASGGFNAAYCVACSTHLKDIYIKYWLNKKN